MCRHSLPKNEGVRPNPGCDFFMKHKGLQKSLYKTMIEEVFWGNHHAQLDQLCVERSKKIFAPYEITAEYGVDFQSAYQLLTEADKHVGLKVLKTWLNGWATSHRMHEEHTLKCVLGCQNEIDSLDHYIHCPHLFAFQRFLFKDTSDDPTIRFGIKTPSHFGFKVISCLFSAYHALKREIRAGKINMQSEEWLRCAWSVFAEVCKAEAGELRVHTRAFSLTKFTICLITGRLQQDASNSIVQHADH